MAKTSKWFVVATEGATTDGRTIQRNWIEEMAESYDPKNTYGARINLDHIKFSMYFEDMPNAMCFGDVLAVKAEEREDGKLQLLAQIQPTDGLIELNKKGQKVYTSVEIDTNFADTGKAYLVGLAVTDSPASLGTEMLQFSAGRKLKADNVFTAAIETALEFEEQEEPKPSLFARITAMFSKKERTNEERFADTDNAVLLLSEHVKEITEKVTALTEENAELKAEFAEISEKYQAMQTQFAELENQPAQNYTPRPKATGESQSDGRFF
ncbi:GPO family capsid scaffolding protein [Basfia succiniciproducens]|uniref:GPO family capsid scaffolding protein n=1 Tax=Basfia succiniciproducens TaxID=653940 RepID=UPI003FCCE2D7